MATAWGGADPVAQVDANDYELGTEYRVNVDVTITHVRIYTPAGETSIANRKARIWTTTGSQLAVVDLPTDMTDGWSTHELVTPLERTANQRHVVSYSTGGNYGALIDAFQLADVNSGDGAVTALSDANATNGNGIFNTTPGAFPTSSPGRHFYGADFVYTLGLASNTAPRITALTSVENGAVATVTAVAEDDETLTGATYRFKWGDGGADTVTTHPTNSAQHTYAATGNYPVLVTVTDAEGLADNEAVVAEIHVADAGTNDFTEAEFKELFSKLTSHAKSIGIFDRVDGGRDPDNKPVGGLAVAFWLNDYKPVPAGSGLAATSMVLDVRATVLCQLGTGKRNPTETEALVLYATHRLMKVLSNDFELDRMVRNIDLLGQTGNAMHADFGHLPYEDTWYRIGEITLPLIINDVYEQVS